MTITAPSTSAIDNLRAEPFTGVALLCVALVRLFDGVLKGNRTGRNRKAANAVCELAMQVRLLPPSPISQADAAYGVGSSRIDWVSESTNLPARWNVMSKVALLATLFIAASRASQSYQTAVMPASPGASSVAASSSSGPVKSATAGLRLRAQAGWFGLLSLAAMPAVNVSIGRTATEPNQFSRSWTVKPEAAGICLSRVR